MAVEFIGRRYKSGIGPVNAAEEEAMGAMSGEADYRVVCTRIGRRSNRHHRFLFALIGIARENYAEPISTENVKEVLKLRTGHVNVIGMASGEVLTLPKSISFESMDQDAFNAWFPRAVDVLCRDFCPGLERHLAMREIERRAGLTFSDPTRQQVAA